MNPTKGFDELNVTLGDMLGRAQNLQPVLTEIAVKQVASFQQNFIEGGRPDKWKQSKRAKKQGGQTLLDSGRLMKSITIPQVTNESITFGSNLPYAAIHQFGGTIHFPARSELFVRNRVDDAYLDRLQARGKDISKERFGSFRKGTKAGRGMTRKAYDVVMPARPYIVWQDSDIVEAGEILLGFMLQRKRITV